MGVRKPAANKPTRIMIAMTSFAIQLRDGSDIVVQRGQRVSTDSELYQAHPEWFVDESLDDVARQRVEQATFPGMPL